MEKDCQKDKILKWFNDWANLKIKLHFSERELYFKERQIWWASLGQNIGSEQNGKHGNFERTVLIFKKFNKQTFLGIPISTKIKTGAHRFVFSQDGKQFCLNMSQMRVMSSKRLLRLVGHISVSEYQNIVQIFKDIA